MIFKTSSSFVIAKIESVNALSFSIELFGIACSS